MRLAVVGYRGFHDYEWARKEINTLLEEERKEGETLECIVSGGAKGADTLAERYAEEHCIKMEVYSPDWKKLGKAAGLIRNTDIVERATHVLAFLSEKSRGTPDTIKKAKALGRYVRVVNIDSVSASSSSSSPSTERSTPRKNKRGYKRHAGRGRQSFLGGRLPSPSSPLPSVLSFFRP